MTRIQSRNDIVLLNLQSFIQKLRMNTKCHHTSAVHNRTVATCVLEEWSRKTGSCGKIPKRRLCCLVQGEVVASSDPLSTWSTARCLVPAHLIVIWMGCSYPHVKVSIRDLSQIFTTALIFEHSHYFRQKFWMNICVFSCPEQLNRWPCPLLVRFPNPLRKWVGVSMP